MNYYRVKLNGKSCGMFVYVGSNFYEARRKAWQLGQDLASHGRVIIQIVKTEVIYDSEED